MKTVDEWAGMTETDQWEEYIRVAMGDMDFSSPDPVVVRLERENERLEKRVSELTKQLAARCCAENCEKEELLASDRELRDEIERLRALLEPCRHDTDTQTDSRYPMTVNDHLSLLSAYIADFLPDDVDVDDEYYGAWERQARPTILRLIEQRDAACRLLGECSEVIDDDGVESIDLLAFLREWSVRVKAKVVEEGDAKTKSADV